MYPKKIKLLSHHRKPIKHVTIITVIMRCIGRLQINAHRLIDCYPCRENFAFGPKYLIH